jgi:hypothetical protein
MYTELPTITTSTASERLQALRDAKDLMSGTEAGGVGAALFGPTKTTPGASAPAIDGFIRLAEYITTGHDYRDTHPEGKRRPKITNVTVVAPVSATAGQLEHFLEHVKDGSFVEFLERMKKSEGVDVDDLIADLLSRDGQPEQADGEKSADEIPVDGEDNRPTFG